jgi:hypothetical protein
MHNIIFVNVIEWDADHCENSKNVFFWNQLLFSVTLENVCQTLIAFLHYNAWKIMLIFDDINDLANHRVFKRPFSAHFLVSFN